MGYRLYGSEDVQRLYRILALRQLGLSLKDIDAALAGDWADLRQAIARHLAEVQRQVVLSRSLEHMLRRLLDQFDRHQDLTNEQFIDAMETIVSFTHLYSGKVREIYDAGDGRLLFVASDRMSAFDVVMGEAVPDKGRVLTAMTAFWLDQLADLAPSHLVSLDVADYPADAVESVPGGEAELKGRSMLVRKAEMLQIECIVRGYITGSAWKDTSRAGRCTAPRCPPAAGASRLPEPVFTPSTKAATGHDENIVQGRLRHRRRQPGQGGSRAVAGRLRAGRGAGGRARDPHRRHQVRARDDRRAPLAVRRGADARLVASGRPTVEARQHAAVVRQAAAARSPRDARLGQDAAAPGAAGRGHRRVPRALRDRVRAHHRPALRRLARRDQAAKAHLRGLLDERDERLLVEVRELLEPHTRLADAGLWEPVDVPPRRSPRVGREQYSEMYEALLAIESLQASPSRPLA